MTGEEADALLDALMERLAAIEHERWAHWQRYMHSKGIMNPDGSRILPKEFIARWERQLSTPYGELQEAEKESDREQVRKYLPVIAAALSSKP